MPKEDAEIGLKAHKSPIREMTGLARINEEVYRTLEMDDEHKITVSNEKGEGVVVKVTSDHLMDRDSISLRSQDFDNLHVNEGDVVHIQVRKTISETLKDAKQKIFKKGNEEEAEVARKKEIEREENYERKKDLEGEGGE